MLRISWTEKLTNEEVWKKQNRAQSEMGEEEEDGTGRDIICQGQNASITKKVLYWKPPEEREATRNMEKLNANGIQRL